ncbi:MAG: hypothetical protein PHT41_04140 [Candidatus Omnitrophica bacterium]|nr:hypothetical protein [Candidatus Omnitrophota bacterium]MDD5238433.1 hypothetical protein [Candidatus Omnitrophota bacterium]
MVDKTQIQALYWDKKYTIKETAKKLDISFWMLYNLMNKYKINRRDSSQAGYNYNKIKPQFEIKQNLSIAEEKLKVAGIMLYWAEGTLKGRTIDFVNSSPEMIRIFLRFLREICGIKEERLKVYLYSYSQHNLRKLKSYWHKVTEIPLSQFTKPYIRESNSNLSNRKLSHGLVHIRYNDSRLLALIKTWIQNYIYGQVPKWPKGADCLKSSASLKGEVEK